MPSWRSMTKIAGSGSGSGSISQRHGGSGSLIVGEVPTLAPKSARIIPQTGPGARPASSTTFTPRNAITSGDTNLKQELFWAAKFLHIHADSVLCIRIRSRIRNFLQDPDPESDPDPCSPYPEWIWNKTSVIKFTVSQPDYLYVSLYHTDRANYLFQNNRLYISH
jgi:hypothetical protein